MNYKETTRGKLINRLETAPSQPWANMFPWKYSSPPMLFGSPIFEAIRGNQKDLQVGDDIEDNVVGSNSRIEGNSLCVMNLISFAVFNMNWMNLFVERKSWIEMILQFYKE